jgi:predicted dehydrogenase
MVKVGVVGVGYWGKKHVEELRALGAEVFVADPSLRDLETCRQKFGAHPWALEDILSDREIVGVTICTPIPTHYQISKRALQAGKHTLVEKPLATTVRQAEYQIRLASRNRLLLAVGHIYRFNNAINRVKQLLHDRYFGDIYIVKYVWTNLEPIYRDRDIISDLAPHPFDITEYLFGGKVDEISCVANSYRQRDLVEAAFINCRLGRTLVSIELSWLTPVKQRLMYIVGSERSASINCQAQKIEPLNSEQPITIQQNNTIRDELHHFLDCIENGTRSVADGESAVTAIRMVELTQKALRGKRTIRVNV